jgi:hypothetical protein
VLILERCHFASKSFTAVREALNNEYPEKEMQNNPTEHQLVTTIQGTGSEVCASDKCSSSDKTADTRPYR